MEVFGIIILFAIVAIVLYIYINQEKQKETEKVKQERDSKISSLTEEIDVLKRTLQQARKDAESAKCASEAKFLAERAIEEVDIISCNINQLEKTIQGIELQPMQDSSSHEKIKECEAQVGNLSKKVTSAKKQASEAVNKRIAQTSRVPYTILNIPFLTTTFKTDYSKRLYVKYSISDSTDKKFPIIRAPRKGCEIKLPVVGRKNNRGASEQSFCNKIVEYGLQNHFYDYLSLFCGSLSFPYEPDLAYIDAEKGIFLDVEIDEPYVGWDRTPIHYKINEGTIDDIRNEHFTERGWCVIRFAEKQIHNEPLSCLKKIFELLHQMDASITIPSVLAKVQDLKPEDWWSKSTAEAMERNKDRELYLNISKFNPPSAISVQINDYMGGRLVEAHIIEHKDQICWNECVRNNDFDTYKRNFPKGIHANEVAQKEDEILWKECEGKKDYQTYIRYSKLKTHIVLAQQKQAQKAEQEKAAYEEKMRKLREAEAIRQREEDARIQREKEAAEKKRLQDLANQRRAEIEKQQREEQERRRKEEEQRRLEAQRYERQAITTASTPTKTPSSRGYA